jgi:hypothetical protein
VLAIKDEARAAVVDVYNDLEASLYELNDMYDRYYSERNFTKASEIQETRDNVWAEFEVARLDMELIN